MQQDFSLSLMREYRFPLYELLSQIQEHRKYLIVCQRDKDLFISHHQTFPHFLFDELKENEKRQEKILAPGVHYVRIGGNGELQYLLFGKQIAKHLRRLNKEWETAPPFEELPFPPVYVKNPVSIIRLSLNESWVALESFFTSAPFQRFPCFENINGHLASTAISMNRCAYDAVDSFTYTMTCSSTDSTAARVDLVKEGVIRARVKSKYDEDLWWYYSVFGIATSTLELIFGEGKVTFPRTLKQEEWFAGWPRFYNAVKGT